MPGDTTRRRLTLADLRKPLIDLTEPPGTAPRPVEPPAAPKPPPKVTQPPQPPPTPQRAPGEKTEAQRAKAKRHRQRRHAKRVVELRPQVEELLGQLQVRWPVAFARGAPKPLAIGVHHQIQAELGCSPEVLENAMRVWCSRPAYLAAAAVGTHRHDLAGAPVAELTAEERLGAKARLDALQVRARTQRPR